MRSAAFIDGANLHAMSKALGAEIDYKRLLGWLHGDGDLVRAGYYTTTLDGDDFIPIKPLIDWLAYNGFQVHTKPVKERTDAQGRFRVTGSIKVDLAVDALAAACDWRLESILLFSGDGEFVPLVRAIQRRGVRVSLVAALEGLSSPMVADELRREADHFIDLKNIMPSIRRTERRERVVAAAE